MTVALGTSCRSSSSRLAASCPARKVTPVILPPGQLRLATRPSLIGIAAPAKDNRNCRRRRPWRQRRGGVGHDHSGRTADQFGRQQRQLVRLVVRIPIFDNDVLPFDKTSLLQTLTEARNEARRYCAGCTSQKADHRHGLLRARGERQRRRTADPRDEVAPAHY